MDWNNSLFENKVRKIDADENKIKQLQISALKRKSFVDSHPITDSNSSVLITELFNAAEQLVNAVIESYGFQVDTKECVHYFLRDVLSNNFICNSMKQYEKLCREITSQGRNISAKEGLQIIQELKFLLEELQKEVRYSRR